MRRFIYSIVLLSFLLLSSSWPALAQSERTAGSLGDTNVSNAPLVANPTINCGVAGSEGKNACCMSKAVRFGIDPNFGSDFPLVGPVVVNPVVRLLSGLVENVPWVFFTFGDLPDWHKTKQGLNNMKLCYSGQDKVVPDASNPGQYMCTCISDDSALGKLTKLCNIIRSPDEQRRCLACIGGTDTQNATGDKKIWGVWTSLGCINVTSPKGFIEGFVFTIGLSFAGMFAVGCIVFAAIQMQLSQGNPEKIKKAQEMLTSCIAGLMIIIFSIFILRVIGVDVLGLPGFK